MSGNHSAQYRIGNTHDREEINMENLTTVFNKAHDSILIVDCEQNGNIDHFLGNLITKSHQVIIFKHFSNVYNLSDTNEEIWLAK